MPATPTHSQPPIQAHQRGTGSEKRRSHLYSVAALRHTLAAGCCLWATAACATAATYGAFSDAPGSIAVMAEASQPGTAETLRAFGAVERFIRGTSDTVDATELPAVYGCSVVVRLAGEIVGRGSAIGGPGAVPATGRIAEAAKAAWENAEPRLPVRGTGEPRAAMLRMLRQDLLISLELSGPPMRINANAYGDFDATLQPGLDGLLAALGDHVGAVFPGTAASGNIMPSEAARRSVGIVAAIARGDAGGGATVVLTEPAELEKKQGITLYRFRTTHVAQWRADKGPELLYRGQKLVLQSDVDQVAELWHTADRLAGHLANRTGGWMEQTVSLATGATETPDEPAFSVAVAKVALDRYLAARGNDAIADSVRARLPRWESALATRAQLVESPTVDAGALLAGSPITTAAAARLHASVAAADPLSEHSIIAFALVSTSSAPGLWPEAAADGRSLTRRVFSRCTPGTLGSHMPWIGWAELDARSRDKVEDLPSAPALREMRNLIWKHQFQAVDAGPDGQDMVGGIVVPGSNRPLPTWQTARLVAFLGTMLGEPALTSKQERGAEVVKLLGAARYLRQLQVDDSLGWLCNDATMAKGGLRNATWDQRTQADGTAMGLLAVLEIIKGIEKASAD